MSYEIRTRRLDPQPVLSIRGPVDPDGIEEAVGEFLGEVWKKLEADGREPAGPPFTRYHQIGESELVLEAGFPVSEEAAGEGRIESGELPGGEAISTDHIGPYEELPAAGEALEAWARERGRSAAGPRWEVYWTDPGEVEDPEQWRTEVFMPLQPR